MGDEWAHAEVADAPASAEAATAGRLPSANRRWIIRYALLMTAAVNLVVNGLLAWLTTIGHSHLKLAGMPLIAPPSLIVDTLGTFAILPVTTSLLCPLGVRGYRRRGLLDSVRMPLGRLGWLERLPDGDLGAGIVLAAWTTALLGPGACVLLVALVSNGVSRGSFVVYKAVLGVALGAVVTPLVALKAMSQPAVTDGLLA